MLEPRLAGDSIKKVVNKLIFKRIFFSKNSHFFYPGNLGGIFFSLNIVEGSYEPLVCIY